MKKEMKKHGKNNKPSFFYFIPLYKKYLKPKKREGA
jgi:hypothetical protein